MNIVQQHAVQVLLRKTIITVTHTHIRLTALFPGLPGWAGTRKVKPIWISLKQETVSGSGISCAICKSAPRSRQITTPAPHHSSFLQAGWPSCRPTNSVKALKVCSDTYMKIKKNICLSNRPISLTKDREQTYQSHSQNKQLNPAYSCYTKKPLSNRSVLHWPNLQHGSRQINKLLNKKNLRYLHSNRHAESICYSQWYPGNSTFLVIFDTYSTACSHQHKPQQLFRQCKFGSRNQIVR